MPGIVCEHCTALCCRYIALPIETPESSRDYDDIRWYLLHEGISVFIEDGEWFLNVQTTCRHLRADQRCDIYQTRPRICREYSAQNCDYHSGDYGWQAHFTCPQHLDEYRRAQRGRRSTRRRGRPKRRNGRARLGVGPRRAGAGPDPYSRARADLRGVPLPVLPPE